READSEFDARNPPAWRPPPRKAERQFVAALRLPASSARATSPLGGQIRRLPDRLDFVAPRLAALLPFAPRRLRQPIFSPLPSIARANQPAACVSPQLPLDSHSHGWCCKSLAWPR